ncbi:DUF4360 domain-containing protein [Amycolatopsis sp. NPDC059021]|uniref:DUF4360 domain-containing protein n=1 Tax=Amycolatopsis sp. NPDC059021 TaxID=3346704 RepID=UPI00366D4895
MSAMMTVAGLVASLLISPQAATGSPPDKVIIEVVVMNGTACPPGSAAVVVAPDNTSFTVTYRRAAESADVRRNCQISLRIHSPGFTYAIAEADHRGDLVLDNGVRAVLSANYYFQGMTSQTPVTQSFTGPFADAWELLDKPDIAHLVYLPCGEERNLSSTVDLRLSPGTPDPRKNFVTLDSTVFRFAWKSCLSRISR